jgi:hypothetical protein
VFTYTSGKLTRADYADGSYKVLTYTDGKLTRLDHVEADKTTRKDFTYSGGKLAAVTQTVI